MYNKIIDYLLSLDIGQRLLCIDLSLCQDLEMEISPLSELYLEYGILKVYFKTISSYDLYVDIRFLNVYAKIQYCQNIYVVSNEGKNKYYRLLDNINTIFKIDLSNVNFYKMDEVNFNSCESFMSFIKNNGHINTYSIYIEDSAIFNTKNINMLAENMELLKMSLFNLLNMNLNNNYTIKEHVICLNIYYYYGEKVSLNDYRELFDDINVYLLTHLNKETIKYMSKHKITVYINKYCLNEMGKVVLMDKERVNRVFTKQLFDEYY